MTCAEFEFRLVLWMYLHHRPLSDYRAAAEEFRALTLSARP